MGVGGGRWEVDEKTKIPFVNWGVGVGDKESTGKGQVSEEEREERHVGLYE